MNNLLLKSKLLGNSINQTLQKEIYFQSKQITRNRCE